MAGLFGQFTMQEPEQWGQYLPDYDKFNTIQDFDAAREDYYNNMPSAPAFAPPSSYTDPLTGQTFQAAGNTSAGGKTEAEYWADRWNNRAMQTMKLGQNPKTADHPNYKAFMQNFVSFIGQHPDKAQAMYDAMDASGNATLLEPLLAIMEKYGYAPTDYTPAPPGGGVQGGQANRMGGGSQTTMFEDGSSRTSPVNRTKDGFNTGGVGFRGGPHTPMTRPGSGFDTSGVGFGGGPHQSFSPGNGFDGSGADFRGGPHVPMLPGGNDGGGPGGSWLEQMLNSEKTPGQPTPSMRPYEVMTPELRQELAMQAGIPPQMAMSVDQRIQEALMRLRGMQKPGFQPPIAPHGGGNQYLF